MRNYRDIGKSGISFLTAFSSGHTLDQDATGEGLLLHPGLYTNMLLNPNVAVTMNYKTSYFEFNTPNANQNILTNQHLGTTNFSYEVIANGNI